LSERLRSTQAEIQTLRSEILPGAESAWQAAVTGFELGKFSFLETLDAQRTLLQARAQYLRALSELYRTTSDIDRLLGSSSSSNAAPSQP
jgi:cobalt-zinc-cadmium efflux system outer membrane protein